MPKGKQPFIILLSLTVIILVGFVSFLIQSDNAKKALTAQKTKLLNDQKFTTFRDGYFRVDYPYWPDLDQKYLLEPKTVKKAVNNNNCSLVITKNTLAKNQTFKDYVENTLKEQGSKYESVKIITKNISDTESTLVGKLTVSGVTLYSYSKGYLTKANGVYSIAFISPQKDFALACSPFLEKTFGSVKIN
jgi:hypothetical protein